MTTSYFLLVPWGMDRFLPMVITTGIKRKQKKRRVYAGKLVSPAKLENRDQGKRETGCAWHQIGLAAIQLGISLGSFLWVSRLGWRGLLRLFGCLVRA
jgi:hypothetical protein